MNHFAAEVLVKDRLDALEAELRHRQVLSQVKRMPLLALRLLTEACCTAVRAQVVLRWGRLCLKSPPVPIQLSAQR